MKEARQFLSLSMGKVCVSTLRKSSMYACTKGCAYCMYSTCWTWYFYRIMINWAYWGRERENTHGANWGIIISETRQYFDDEKKKSLLRAYMQIWPFAYMTFSIYFCRSPNISDASNNGWKRPYETSLKRKTIAFYSFRSSTRLMNLMFCQYLSVEKRGVCN